MARLVHLVVLLFLAIVFQASVATAQPRRYVITNRGLWAKTSPGESRREDLITLSQEPEKPGQQYEWDLFAIPYDKALFRIQNVEKGYTAAASSEKSGSVVVAKQFGASNWRIDYHPVENKRIIRLEGSDLVWSRRGNEIVLEKFQGKFSQLWSFYPINTWYNPICFQ